MPPDRQYTLKRHSKTAWLKASIQLSVTCIIVTRNWVEPWNKATLIPSILSMTHLLHKLIHARVDAKHNTFVYGNRNVIVFSSHHHVQWRVLFLFLNTVVASNTLTLFPAHKSLGTWQPTVLQLIKTVNSITLNPSEMLHRIQSIITPLISIIRKLPCMRQLNKEIWMQ